MSPNSVMSDRPSPSSPSGPTRGRGRGRGRPRGRGGGGGTGSRTGTPSGSGGRASGVGSGANVKGYQGGSAGGGGGGRPGGGVVTTSSGAVITVLSVGGSTPARIARGAASSPRNVRVSRSARATRPPRSRGDASGAGPGSARAARPAVKLCIRFLPPRITVAEFFATADPTNCATWTALRQGSSRPADSQSQPRPSVAYAAFATLDEADSFYDRIHGTAFLEASSGTRYIAHVERALNQAIPKPNRKSSLALANTIETDPDYLKFLAAYDDERRVEHALNAPQSLSDTDALFRDAPGSETASAGSKTATNGSLGATGVAIIEGAGTADPGVVVTPLIEDVRARRRERDGAKAAAKKANRRARRVAAPATSGTASSAGGSGATWTGGTKTSSASSSYPTKSPAPQTAGTQPREKRTPKAKITVLHSVTCPTGSRLVKGSSSSSTQGTPSLEEGSSSNLQNSDPVDTRPHEIAGSVNGGGAGRIDTSEAPATPKSTKKRGAGRPSGGASSGGGRRGSKAGAKAERSGASTTPGRNGLVQQQGAGGNGPSSKPADAGPAASPGASRQSSGPGQGTPKPSARVRLLRKQTDSH